MGRMSFTQEMKRLGKAGEGVDARGCRETVLFLHQELGRAETALGRAGWTMRYGQRGEWRMVLREAAAETLREAHRAASDYNRERLRRAVTCYLRLAGFPYGEVAELMLRPEERCTAPVAARRRSERVEHVAAEVRWTGASSPRNGRRRRGRERRERELAAAA
jgi:hypothetical protein